MTQMLYLQTKLLITLFLFVKVITMSVYSNKLAFSRTLVTLLTKILVLRNELIYFVKHETKSNKCYTENEVISMLEFLIDSISVEFGGHIFQQIIGISVGTNWSPLLDDLFPYSFSC